MNEENQVLVEHQVTLKDSDGNVFYGPLLHDFVFQAVEDEQNAFNVFALYCGSSSIYIIYQSKNAFLWQRVLPIQYDIVGHATNTTDVTDNMIVATTKREEYIYIFLRGGHLFVFDTKENKIQLMPPNWKSEPSLTEIVTASLACGGFFKGYLYLVAFDINLIYRFHLEDKLWESLGCPIRVNTEDFISIEGGYLCLRNSIMIDDAFLLSFDGSLRKFVSEPIYNWKTLPPTDFNNWRTSPPTDFKYSVSEGQVNLSWKQPKSFNSVFQVKLNGECLYSGSDTRCQIEIPLDLQEKLCLSIYAYPPGYEHLNPFWSELQVTINSADSTYLLTLVQQPAPLVMDMQVYSESTSVYQGFYY